MTTQTATLVSIYDEHAVVHYTVRGHFFVGTLLYFSIFL